MVSFDSDKRTAPGPAAATTAVKILIAGGFGVGKTTLVAAVSEITPLNTEEYLTAAGQEVDDTGGVEQKATTTVALDFGRITIGTGLVVYLFGTPGQERFWFMWNDLVNGALGAVVVADTRRLQDSFAAIDFFESRGVSFVVGVNCFGGRQERTVSEVREALDLDARVPILMGDFRQRPVSRDVLVALIEHLMAEAGSEPAAVVR